MKKKNDTILARWLSGELTLKEKVDFEKTAGFEEYKRIQKGLEYFKKPSFDREKMHHQISNRLKAPKKSKIIPIRPIVYFTSLAASFILIIGIFF